MRKVKNDRERNRVQNMVEAKRITLDRKKWKGAINDAMLQARVWK